jgi:hypothetical protein
MVTLLIATHPGEIRARKGTLKAQDCQKGHGWNAQGVGLLDGSNPERRTPYVEA